MTEMKIASSRPITTGARGRLTLLIAVLTVLLVGCNNSAQSPQPAPPHLDQVQLIDLDGKTVYPLRSPDADVNVYIFTRFDCPVSNRFAPAINRLHKKYDARGVAFHLVYPDPKQDPNVIRQHRKDYGYECRALRDPKHTLVKVSGVTTTPEAAVFTRNGRLAYAGRIDDRAPERGVIRDPSTHELKDAIEALLNGQPVKIARTSPGAGCFISDLQ